MDQPSIVKQFALNTLQCFNDLAQPEIHNRIVRKFWEYMRDYTYKIIMKKPDSELRIKLKQVHETLGPLFNDVDISEQIKEGEKLGSPEIPRVGELARVKELTQDTEKELMKELGF